MRLTLPIWTPPVVQEELKKWSTWVGLHVYIRLVCEQFCSSPDGNPHAEFPYAQRSQRGPGALSECLGVGLTCCPSRHAFLQPVVSRLKSSLAILPLYNEALLGSHLILVSPRQQRPHNPGMFGG